MGGKAGGTLNDLRYAARLLRKRPLFAAAAIVTLALGIGANASIFSIADGMLFRPLPYPHPNRLVSLLEQSSKNEAFGSMARETFNAIRTANESFEAIGVTSGEFIDTLIGVDQPLRVHAYEVSPQLLPALGVEPRFGRTFAAEDFHGGAERAALLMPAFWLRLGGDPTIVGSLLRLEDHTLRVVGVMPPGFVLPSADSEADVLTPAFDDPARAPAAHARVLRPIARLRPTVTMAQAQAEAEAIAGGVQSQQVSRAQAHLTVRVRGLQDDIFHSTRSVLVMLLGAAGFVLLIVCANLSSLLLARGTLRERELAVRTALGASRSRLVRQLIVESLLLATIGGALGVCIAYTTFDLVQALVPRRAYSMLPAGVDGRVVWFATLASLTAGLLFGAAPALQFSRPDLTRSLQKGRASLRSHSRMWRTGSALVAAEVALVVVLLAGAGLMVKSFIRLRSVDLGFQPDRVDLLDIRFPRGRYSRSAAYQFDWQLLDRLRAQPGIEAAAGVAGVPLISTGWDRLTLPTGTEGEVWLVTSDYFRTLGIRVIAGRPFTAREAMSNAPVAVLSERAARLGWPNGDAIGRTITNGRETPRIIIGVVADVRRTLREPAQPVMYTPFDPAVFAWMSIVVRSSVEPGTIRAMLAGQVHAVDPRLLVTSTPFPVLVDPQIALPRFQAALFSVFAVLGLTLAAVGIFGVVGYVVSHRTNEIGIRIALGANPRQVLAMVMRQALMPVLAGMACGLVGAFWSTQLLAQWLFEVQPHDRSTLFTVSILVGVTALVASYLPAHRASRVDPIEALRAE